VDLALILRFPVSNRLAVSSAQRFLAPGLQPVAEPVDRSISEADDEDEFSQVTRPRLHQPEGETTAGAVMGIYDREYYRGETEGSGWFSGPAPATRTIILINVVVFILQLLQKDGSFQTWFAASSNDIFHRGWVWQLLTATFLHSPDDLWHIFLNMLFLWYVGRELESMYGSRDFVAMYLGAAIFSTFIWAVFDYSGRVHRPMMGASGAVLAAIVIYAMYYPRQKVLLFFVIPVEMWLLLVVYLGIQALQFLQGQDTPIALASHLSGAAYGYLYKTFDLRWSHLPWRRVRRPRFRVIAPEPREKPKVTRPAGPTWSPNPAAAAKPSTTAVLPEEQLDAKLDEVLAKIAREGRGGLTEEENRVLLEASRRARDRRSDRL
jgi:membrane associated rhomboid family serine protease